MRFIDFLELVEKKQGRYRPQRQMDTSIFYIPSMLTPREKSRPGQVAVPEAGPYQGSQTFLGRLHHWDSIWDLIHRALLHLVLIFKYIYIYIYLILLNVILCLLSIDFGELTQSFLNCEAQLRSHQLNRKKFRLLSSLKGPLMGGFHQWGYPKMNLHPLIIMRYFPRFSLTKTIHLWHPPCICGRPYAV